MATTENPYAGQGPVLLDIGGDVGALVVSMPAETVDLEVEIRPAGTTAAGGHVHAHPHPHPHGDGAGHAHAHDPSPFAHVGVVARPSVSGTHHSLVYPELVEGDYELCPLPAGDVVLTATVVGGRVTELVWPR